MYTVVGPQTTILTRSIGIQYSPTVVHPSLIHKMNHSQWYTSRWCLISQWLRAPNDSHIDLSSQILLSNWNHPRGLGSTYIVGVHGNSWLGSTVVYIHGRVTSTGSDPDRCRDGDRVVDVRKCTIRCGVRNRSR